MDKAIDPRAALRIEMLSSLEKYTRAMFKAQYKRSFVVNSHHKQLFKAFEDVVDGKIKRLIINMPPRYGKTEVAVKSFISWCYALNPTCRFLHLSYSDMLVNDNSSTIRNIMMEPLYKTLFFNSTLEKERGASNWWKTTKGGEFYAVSTQGQVTGFGAGKVDEDDNAPTDNFETLIGGELGKMLDYIGAANNIFEGAIVIDDPLKPEDALSDTVRERINQRFENTIRNRTNSRNTPIIIIMQRLHENDLCGYLMGVEPDEWTVVSLPAIQTDDNGNEVSLWDKKHTLAELKHMRSINTHVFDTQYMQDPKPKEGLMYSNGFRTYTPDIIPMVLRGKAEKINYTDTADTGADSLCSICGIDTQDFIYVTDVLYTDKPMEYTEPATADLLNRNGTQISKIESNNGGRGFARAVEKELRLKYKNRRARITYFTQTENKFVRINIHSAEVQNVVLFPEDWDKRWPKFYNAITSYRKDNRRRSQHDDAPDCLTGLVEMRNSKTSKRKIKQKN